MGKNKPQTQTRIKFISYPETLVLVGEELLLSHDCLEVLGGLALMTGLASDSMLANSQIKEKTAYSVIFTQSYLNYKKCSNFLPTKLMNSLEKNWKLTAQLMDN